MNKTICILLGAVALPATLMAAPPGKPDIVVMTQNQYLGADLNPIIAAGNLVEYNEAALEAIAAIAAKNAPERMAALADTIRERSPHLVGLQEVFRFECEETGTIPGACLWFDAAMNDHLQLTMDALGGDYYVAGVVDNLTIPDADFSLPGLPAFLDLDLVPDVFVKVYDRDVILARNDVVAVPSALPCIGGKPSADGCNYFVIGEADAIGETIRVQRGFVAVDATVGGMPYRFVNTHLEVQFPSPAPEAPLIQAAQATELVATLSLFPPPAGTTTIVAGDINSSPADPVFWAPPGFDAYPPYLQLAMGVDLTGAPIAPPYSDSWTLRPGKPPGLTCCEASDLLNAVSIHDERVDVVFTFPQPSRVKANVMNNDPEDKTASGLWPSDHSGVVVRLNF